MLGLKSVFRGFMTFAVGASEFELERRNYLLFYMQGQWRMRGVLERGVQQGLFTQAEMDANPVPDGPLKNVLKLADAAFEVVGKNPTFTPQQTLQLLERQHPSQVRETLQSLTHGEGHVSMAAARRYLTENIIPEVAHYYRDYARSTLAGATYFQREVAAEPQRVRPFVPNRAREAEVSARLAASGQPVELLGARQGEYVVASTDGTTPTVPLIGTDYLMDCVAVVLQGVDPANPKKQVSVLGHIDIVTNPDQAVADMLSHIPQSYRVRATMLGSKQSDNPYTNTMVLHALREQPRIQSIRHDTNLATTLAVDVQTGTILHHGRDESIATSYNIGDGEFPFRVHSNFPDHPHGLGTDRFQLWQYVQMGWNPSQPIPRVRAFVQAGNAPDTIQKDAQSLQSMVEVAVSDHRLTLDEQRDILKKASETFGIANITLDTTHSDRLLLMRGNIPLANFPKPQGLTVDEAPPVRR